MLRFPTRAAHAGCSPSDDSSAVIPPIHFATTFERGPDGSYPGGHVYSRIGNPTRNRFEESMAGLEGGSACFAFASGMAAADAVFRTLGPGDHVVIPDDAYYGVRHLLAEVFAPWGLSATAVDQSDLAAVARALRPNTRLVWIESPSNPLLRITDIEAVAHLAHENGSRVVVDGTWTTPLLQTPLDLSADAVVHSVTKYLAGHSDVLGGAVIVAKGQEAWADQLATIQSGAGAVMDPMSAWLAMRGIRSLGARLDRQCQSAEHIARFLDGHDAIERVHYPGLASDPGHGVASRQMSQFGGMLSIRIKGGVDAAQRVTQRVSVFRRATSLGGTESLIEHRASVEAQPSTTPGNLLRLSIGLEDVQDLLDDLRNALLS